MKLKISNTSLLTSLLTIAFCIAPYFVNAQLRVMIAGGYGTYSMNDLTELQQSTSRNFPAKGRNISVYPGYYNFEGSLVYETKGPLFAGFIAGYGSSGARSWYSDYSGSINYDQKAKYFSAGASIGFSQKVLTEKTRIYFDLRPGIILTDLDIVYNERIETEETHEHFKFSSANISIQPTATVTQRLGKFGLNLFVGVNINLLCGKLTSIDDPEIFLQDDSGNDLTADWTGLRVGAGISYYFWN